MGNDLSTYPANWTKTGSSLTVFTEKRHQLIIKKRMIFIQHLIYNPHKWFTMNRKKVLNIALDKNIGKSAATAKMVSDLELKLGPYTKNNVYREIFEEFYDFSDASNYKLTLRASGITFTGINPNITFPQMNIANVWEDTLRLKNPTLSLSLYGKWNYAICVVMQLWLDRSISIKTFYTTVLGETQKPNLIYDKTTKKLKLQTYSNNETSITLLNSFNGKRIVLWLTKFGGVPGSGGNTTVKHQASISNHSATLTLPSSTFSQGTRTFKIFSEDAVIYKVMHSSNFFDFDSEKNNVAREIEWLIRSVNCLN